jgi:cytochrome b
MKHAANKRQEVIFMANQNNTALYAQYHVWDRTVRIFHWINAICVIGLIGIGLVILNSKSLGISTDGKIALKTVHIYIGYVFVLNLFWRGIWGFICDRHSRWTTIYAFGKDYRKSLLSFIYGIREKKQIYFLGHNPLAKPMVAFIFLLLATQAVTGLILAGTDLYKPPFGHVIAEWVTNSSGDHSKLADLKPYSMVNVDPESYEDMRKFRKPIVNIHEYTFFTLIVVIVLHLFGIIVAEISEKCGLVSSMFTGKKVFPEKPIDLGKYKSSNLTG